MRVLSNKLKAFTLAEVIIALAVVGVVAALTIPNISRNMQAAQAKTAFKKALNEINQTLSEFTLNEGRNLAQTTDTDVEDIKKIFTDSKYLAGREVDTANRWNIITNLTPTYANDGSITASSTIDDSTLSSSYNYYVMPDNFANIAFIISDDMYGCGVPHLSRDNDGSYANDTNNEPLANAACLAYIDINGPKGPNMVLMGATDSNPANDACANIVVPPTGNYMIKKPDNNGEYCQLKDNSITDVFPVVFFNDKVYPATVAGYWILNDLVGQEITEQAASGE